MNSNINWMDSDLWFVDRHDAYHKLNELMHIEYAMVNPVDPKESYLISYLTSNLIYRLYVAIGLGLLMWAIAIVLIFIQLQ